MGKIKDEIWTLSSVDTTAIPSGNRADTVASKWGDIWKYQVPTGQAHILKPSHRFSAYLYDAGTTPAEVANTGLIKIEVRDQSEADSKVIFGQVMYVQCKEFTDVRKIATLSLQQDLAVEERFWIVVMGYYANIIDESASYFKLETVRIRSTI